MLVSGVVEGGEEGLGLMYYLSLRDLSAGLFMAEKRVKTTC